MYSLSRLINDYDDDNVHDMFENVGEGSLKTSDIKAFFSRCWYTDRILDWTIDKLNLQTKETLCFSYIDSVVDGMLQREVLEKYHDKNPKRLVVFLNVGRSTFSENQNFLNETYIGQFEDSDGKFS